MEILQTISLDFGKDTEPITVFAKQGDAETRYIEISLLNKGQKYSLEAGITARLHITKPDGKIVLSDAAVTSATTIRAELSKQALAAPGIAVAEIGLYKGNALLSSQLFYIRIEKRAYSDDAIESTDEYKCLIDALNEVEPAVKKADSAASAATTAAETAATKAAEAEAATVDTIAATAAANEVVNNSQAEIGALRNELTRQKQINKSQDLEIEKLRAAAEGNLYLFKADSEEAYEKAVPADVMSYAAFDKIGGKTLVWNQIFPILNKASVTHNGITFSINNSVFTYSGTIEATFGGYVDLFAEHPTSSFIVGHKYFIRVRNVSNLSKKFYLVISSPYVELEANRVYIWTHTEASNFMYVRIRASESSIGETISGEGRIEIFDLTLMFGAGNEPATPEEFRAMFPAKYYPYSAPTLQNFSSKTIESRGRNLFDPSVFDVVEGITKSGDEYCGLANAFYRYFGAENNFLPLDCVEMPQILSISATIRLENAVEHEFLSFSIAAQYTDGTNEAIIVVHSLDAKSAVYKASTNPDKIVKGIKLSYGDSKGEIVCISKIMITVGSTPEEYIPYHSIAYDTSAIVQKYFPDGMKSAGNVHDEIDFERMVAIQRVGSILFDGVNAKVSGADSNYTDTSFKYNYAYLSATEQWVAPRGELTTSIGTVKEIRNGHLIGGCFTSSVISLFIPNVAVEGNTQQEYLAAFNEILKKNPVEVNYELKTPIETPITEFFEETIEVESGGALTFKNDKGNNFQVPVPNQETFMIKLPNGGTA